MTDNQDHPYSAEYLRRYIEGLLPDSEMHAIEKAALDDPFLSDAIDGLRRVKTEKLNIEAEVADLKRRISTRIDHRRNRLLPGIWKVAASVIFLVLLTGLAVTLVNSRSKKSDIAVVPVKDSLHAAEKNDTERRKIIPEAIPAVPDRMDSGPPSSEPVNLKKSAGRARAHPAETKALRDPVGYRNEEATNPAISRDTVPMAAAQAPATATQSLQGKAAGLEVEKGFSKEQIKKRGVHKDKDRLNPDVMPIHGWEEYETYLTTHKRTATLDSSIQGTEIIRFAVDSLGRFSDFKIIQSLSLAHDAECMRLVREGPSWKIVQGSFQTCELEIHF